MEFDAQKQVELTRMKFWATGLLLVVTIIYVVASIFERRYEGVSLGFIVAFAEAAMVGAIADWFAVTALFKHPLGLKIPHTAIIPYRKNAIAEQFGHFVQTNFLSAEVIANKLRTENIAEQLARWISQPENSQLIANQVSAGLLGIVQVMNDKDIQLVIERSLQTQIKLTKFAPILGNLLSLLTSGERKQELLQGAVQAGIYVLEENKEVIIEQIAKETPWWLPDPVDKAIHKKIVESVQKTLKDINATPNHPLQQRFNVAVDKFLEDLQESPEMLAKEETLKEDLLQQAVVQEFTSSLWLDIKAWLLEYSSTPNTEYRGAIQHGIVQFGNSLLADEVLLEKTNRWIEEGAIYLTQKYGHEVAKLISETVKKWDAQDASHKIELQIGKDLQYIRINGTLVGGLIGVLIHTLSLLLSRVS